MKKLCLLLFTLTLLINIQAYPIEMKLSLERINVDFYGVVNSDITAVCYGTGSIILTSTDNGINWKQKCIHDDSLGILDMVYENNQFYALLNRDYYVIGDKQANNWNSIFTGISGQQSIEVHEDFVFILGLNELYIFKVNQLQNKIELIDTNKYSELKIFKNHLIVSGANGKLISIDLNSYEQNLIDLAQLGVCQNCKALRRMITEGNSLYLSHGADVLKTEDLNTWTIVSRNATLYSVKDGDIYSLRMLNTNKLMSANLAFYKSYSGDTVRINQDWVQRNVDILVVNDFRFINDSVIIAVGRDKLIANSLNQGINWELISNSQSLGFLILNDSIYYSIQSKCRIYRTLNFGVTWLPPLYIDTTMTLFKTPRYAKFYENGYGFVISNDDLTRNNVMKTYDFGNTYTLEENYHLSAFISVHNPMFIITEQGYNMITPGGVAKVPKTDLLKLDSGLKAVSWGNIYDSLVIRGITRLNENEYLGIAEDKHWPYYIDGTTYSNNYWFIKSTNDGETWEKQFEIFMGDTTLKPTINLYDTKLLLGGSYKYKEVRDTPNINQLYIIDMETGNRTRLFNDVESTYNKMTEYKDYLIFGGVECLFVNSNYKEDLSSWVKCGVPGKFISSINYQNERLYSSIYDYRTQKTNSYHVTLDFITDVEKKIETKTYLYSFPPYPNPASNLVRADIYWDSRYDIDEADIGIFNYAGIKISDKKNITIDKKSNFGGTLVWDCSAYSPGVYFIIIRHGNVSRLIPIVVNR